MTVQKAILTISIIILIGFSIFTYYVITRASKTAMFPPRISKCPDYFEYGENPSTGEIHECTNTYELGNYATGKGKNSTYCHFLPKALITSDPRSNISDKCQYISDCNVGWDGLGNDLCTNVDDLETQQ
jgi:hypothetical protein